MEPEELPIITPPKEPQLAEELSEPVTKPIVTPELVGAWRKWFLTQQVSLDTVDSYYSFVKRFVGYKVWLTQKNIDIFREEHHNTVCSGALKSLIKFLVYRKGFPESLLSIRFEKNKQERKVPNTISPEDAERIINGMPDLRDKLLTQTLYTLALRIEEGLKLTWQDFNWEEWLKNKTNPGIVILIGTKRGKFRTISVNPKLMSNLYDNHEARNSAGVPIGNLVFGDNSDFLEILSDKRVEEKLTKEQLEARNKKYYLSLTKRRYRGLLYRVSKATIGKRISPHVFRHSKAQTLMDNNMPIESIQRLLGHASISTTQIYAQVSVQKLQKDLEKYDQDPQGITKGSIITPQLKSSPVTPAKPEIITPEPEIRLISDLPALPTLFKKIPQEPTQTDLQTAEDSLKS